ncbi:TPA: hypothetical protein ACXNDR_003959 [Serratia marcescens]
MRKTTAVIDSPEALGVALCRHVPDMANGFTLTTRDSQLQLVVTAEDARPFITAMERLLMGKIRQIQRGHQERMLDGKLKQLNPNGEKLTAEELVDKYGQQCTAHGAVVVNSAIFPGSFEQKLRVMREVEQRTKPAASQPHPGRSEVTAKGKDCDYATQHMSLEELNALLDRALEQGMPEQMLAPFRNGVKTREEARKLELSYYAWVAVESIRDAHRQRYRRDDQKETSEVSGQGAGSLDCSQQGPSQPGSGGQEQNDSPSPSDKGPGTRQSPDDQTHSL